MKPGNDPVVPVTDPDRNPRPNARRMLLRGSFAAPTLLTLSSGSALAAASSLQCFNKLPSAITDPQPPANFFQVQRYSHDGNKLVDARQITDVASAQGFEAGVFQTNQPLGTVWFDVTNISMPYVVSGAAPTADASNSVALRFNNVGTDEAPILRITGLSSGLSQSSGQENGKVLSSSCWSSFK
jgi:hypothetical protein